MTKREELEGELRHARAKETVRLDKLRVARLREEGLIDALVIVKFRRQDPVRAGLLAKLQQTQAEIHTVLGLLLEAQDAVSAAKDGLDRLDDPEGNPTR